MRTVVLALALAAAACAPSEKKPVGARAQQGDLGELGKVPPFKFLERAGVPVDRETLKGKVWVACFLFTRCPTHCVTICGHMSKMQDEFYDQADFCMVATTVDPAYDTPEVLQKFAKKYKAHEKKWLFLWGRRDDIKSFAYDGLKVQGHPEQLLAHSPYFVLIDRKGVIRGYYDGTENARVRKLRADIRTLLAEKL